MKTHVDWLRFRTQSDPFQVVEAIKPAFIGELLELGDQQRGKDGWEFRRPLNVVDVTVGSIDYGGESQRGWARVDLPGQGCKWVDARDGWGKLHASAFDLERAELTRLDLALDTVDGSVGHGRCVQAYDDGGFSNGGRPPKAKEILPRAGFQGGRTLYVGRREGAKFYRCYEKGWETLDKVPESARSTVLDGGRLIVHGQEVLPQDWYRCEVELKAKDGYCPPWLAVIEPDSYFAGVCPYFGELVPQASPRPVQRMPEFSARLELEAALEHARLAYGAVFKTALLAGMTEQEIFATVVGAKPSERLVKAGVLMIDAGA